MSGSKKISDLLPITNANLHGDDYIIVNDDSETGVDKTKIILISELDARFQNESDFDTDFDNRLGAKTTSDLAEGSNKYYTEDRVDTNFSSKDTGDLSEGSNKYYTEARVIANTDVAANTGKRHNILTLHADASSAGLSLTDQELKHTKSDTTHNGYLDKADFIIFNGKADKSSGDIKETPFSITNNQTTSQVITGFEFDNTTVRSFEALVSVEIDATTNLFEVMRIFGINKDGAWTIERVPSDGNNIGDDTGILFSIATATGKGQMRYTSEDQAGFVSGSIKFRCVVTSI